MMMLTTTYIGQRDRKQNAWQIHGCVVIVLALCACVQGYRWYSGTDSSLEVAESGLTHQEHKFLGRGYQRRLLEQQLIDKEQEISYLRRQIEKAALASSVSITKAEAADARTKEVTALTEFERAQRNKAQLALSEKASMLQACQAQRDAIAAEVDACGNEIMRLTQSRYGEAARARTA